MLNVEMLRSIMPDDRPTSSDEPVHENSDGYPTDPTEYPSATE